MAEAPKKDVAGARAGAGVGAVVCPKKDVAGVEVWPNIDGVDVGA